MSVPQPIADFLMHEGVRYSTFTHPVAYTAQAESAAASVPSRDWAKTVVCFAGEEPVMVVLPAPYLVDLDHLREVVKGGTLRLAREEELQALYPESEPGAMPPLGPLYGQRVIVETHLATNAEIVFNAGTHADAIRMLYQDFEQLVHPEVGQFAH